MCHTSPHVSRPWLHACLCHTHRRYLQLFAVAADKLLPEPSQHALAEHEEDEEGLFEPDIWDVLADQVLVWDLHLFGHIRGAGAQLPGVCVWGVGEGAEPGAGRSRQREGQCAKFAVD